MATFKYTSLTDSGRSMGGTIEAASREQATEMLEATDERKGSVGFGFKDGSAGRGA